MSKLFLFFIGSMDSNGCVVSKIKTIIRLIPVKIWTLSKKAANSLV